VTLFLSTDLLELARARVRELVATGASRGALDPSGDGPRFVLSTTRDGLVVLGRVEVDGVTFFLGVPPAP
jgi:hypothetical protein